MAYVPPHLRSSSQQSSSASSPDPEKQQRRNFNIKKIRQYYNPEESDKMGTRTTLHDSSATPGKLAYAMLFAGANPRWESEGIIYVKSNLNLLVPEAAREEETSSAKLQSEEAHATNTKPASEDFDDHAMPSQALGIPSLPRQPIAVFKQFGHSRKGNGCRFAGYFHISQLEFLEPNSDELVRMLEQKWTQTDGKGNARTVDRDAGSWSATLNVRWAVVKFVAVDEAAGRELGTPEIEHWTAGEGADGGVKGVNEILKELRLRGIKVVETGDEASLV